MGTGFTLLVAFSNAFASLARIPQQMAWVRLALAVCLTGAIIYLAIAGNTQKAVDCPNLYEARSKLYFIRVTGLWEDTDSVNAPALLNDLDARAVGISRSSTSLPHTKRQWGNGRHTEREHGLVAVG